MSFVGILTVQKFVKEVKENKHICEHKTLNNNMMIYFLFFYIRTLCLNDVCKKGYTTSNILHNVVFVVVAVNFLKLTLSHK